LNKEIKLLSSRKLFPNLISLSLLQKKNLEGNKRVGLFLFAFKLETLTLAQALGKSQFIKLFSSSSSK